MFKLKKIIKKVFLKQSNYIYFASGKMLLVEKDDFRIGKFKTIIPIINLNYMESIIKEYHKNGYDILISNVGVYII